MKSNFKLAIFSLGIMLLAVPLLAQSQRPLTLDECVALAMRENSALRNAERRKQIAGTNVIGARAGLLPRTDVNLSSGRSQFGDRTSLGDVPIGFDANGQAIYERRTITQPGYSSNGNRASVDVNQLLFDFGATWSRIKQANASEDASSTTYESTKQSTILLVNQRYLGYLKELQLLKVSEEAVKTSEEQLRRTESMFEIGSVAQGDVFRAKTTNGNDRINLITQQNQVKNARGLLNVAMGRPTDMELDVVDIAEVPAIREYKLDEVVQVAIDKNPELQSFRFQMKSASYGKHVARTAFLPRFSMNASYTRSHNEFDRVYSDFSKNWFGSIGIGMSLNLFNGFADQADIERESLTYRIAEEDYTNRLRTLRLEAEQALLSLQAWKEVTAINSENLLSTQEDLRLAQERYRVGAGTLLDIITAQTNLTRARSTFIRAKYDSMIAYAYLQSVMGTLAQ